MTSLDATVSQDELGNDIDIDGHMAHDDDSHHMDVYDSEMSKDTHQLGVSNGVSTDARRMHVCNVCHNMYDNEAKHDEACKDNWSRCIVMRGTLLTHDVRILFDSGAESNIISESCVKRYDIPTHESKDACNGVMADGTVKPLLHMVLNAPLQIQSYSGMINAYVMPIAAYDVILGMPFHERYNATTYYYKREVHVHSDNGQHVLKQHRTDMGTMHNDILISATQLKRMMKPSRQRDARGKKGKATPPPEMYMVTAIGVSDDGFRANANNQLSSYDDKRQQYVSTGTLHVSHVISHVNSITIKYYYYRAHYHRYYYGSED